MDKVLQVLLGGAISFGAGVILFWLKIKYDEFDKKIEQNKKDTLYLNYFRFSVEDAVSTLMHQHAAVIKMIEALGQNIGGVPHFGQYSSNSIERLVYKTDFEKLFEITNRVFDFNFNKVKLLYRIRKDLDYLATTSKDVEINWHEIRDLRRIRMDKYKENYYLLKNIWLKFNGESGILDEGNEVVMILKPLFEFSNTHDLSSGNLHLLKENILKPLFIELDKKVVLDERYKDYVLPLRNMFQIQTDVETKNEEFLRKLKGYAPELQISIDRVIANVKELLSKKK